MLRMSGCDVHHGSGGRNLVRRVWGAQAATSGQSGSERLWLFGRTGRNQKKMLGPCGGREESAFLRTAVHLRSFASYTEMTKFTFT